MPLFRTQSAAEKTSLAPHDSKARLQAVTTRRDSWRSHVHRTHTAQRVQLFEPQAANVRGQGAWPLAFSWGSKGAILSRERMAPLFRAAPAALLSLADCKESIPSCIIPRLWYKSNFCSATNFPIPELCKFRHTPICTVCFPLRGNQINFSLSNQGILRNPLVWKTLWKLWITHRRISLLNLLC